MFKFIINLSLLCSSFTEPKPDTDGWVTIPPVKKNTFTETDADKDNSSIWALFSKQLGNENLLIRMPEDPKYRYLSSGEMEITSSSKGESYLLNVLNAVPRDSVETQVKDEFFQPEILLEEVSRISSSQWDIFYRKDGKWIAKTYMLKGNHLYIFQTESLFSHRENHQQFVSSLDIKISQK